jgi:crotonobetainyl-CoA:carnitine CoA-transferase CaiB-like acyl-CoA transferase
MSRPLEGIKVVEVAMWAFVPAAGGILSDMGAKVIKVEPPTGDPLRGLRIADSGVERHGFILSWENYNRGKRSVTLDLRRAEGVEILYELLEGADVFLTNLLPPARKRMKIDIEDVRARFPNIIYGVGSGLGQRGPEADKGGFDSITFWARGGIASQITPEDAPYPIVQPSAAFGDCTSAAMLAGAIAAAIAQRAMTGHASVVDVSLLASSMWLMQRSVTQATLDGVARLPKPKRHQISNPLVSIYQTSDGRFVSLCMLQGQRYWPGLCQITGRPDLIKDPRFETEGARTRNVAACIAQLDEIFRSRPLAEWRELLARQEGQWDVVQHVGELKDDRQVKANGFMQPVDYGDGRTLAMVSVPMQFDGAPLGARPAPELGADTEAILQELGYDWDRIGQLKDAGIVF